MELVPAAIRVKVDEHGVLRRVVAHGPGRGAVSTARAADGDERVIAVGPVVVGAEVTVLHVVEGSLVLRVRGSFSLELEDDHARVVAGGEEVHLGVRGEDPEPVVLASKGLHAGSLGHVPDADALIFRVGHDDILPGVEHAAGYVVDVPAEGINLPSLGVVHAPELHLAVVRAGDDERERRVESSPVDAPVVALQHVLDHRVACEQNGSRHSNRAYEK